MCYIESNWNDNEDDQYNLQAALQRLRSKSYRLQ